MLLAEELVKFEVYTLNGVGATVAHDRQDRAKEGWRPTPIADSHLYVSGQEFLDRQELSVWRIIALHHGCIRTSVALALMWTSEEKEPPSDTSSLHPSSSQALHSRGQRV